MLCDRYTDATIAYQGYGRQLDLKMVRAVIDFAVGETRPDLTILLMVPLATSEARRESREAGAAPARDRFEEADRDFFRRVHINVINLREEHGQTMAEYGVVLSVITIAAVAAFFTLGGNISNAINYVASKIKAG